MDWFKIVSKRHDEYLKIVTSFPENQNNEDIQDIVQDAYIEISKLGESKCKEGDKRVNGKYKDLPICQKVLNDDGNGDVNMFFIWIILKRVSMAHLKKKRKEAKYFQRLGEGFDKSDKYEGENEQAFSLLMNNVEQEMESWHWYDKLLFETYIKDDRSMRGLSEDTKISLTSIFTTLRNCKNRIQENVGEDFLDYINKDYELIK